MRIGIYGGSFDPPHIGHRVLVRDAADALELDRLFIVPTGAQPLKVKKSDGALPEQRLAMARIAFAGDELVVVDETEAKRPGLSFTVDTLEEYSARYSGSQLFLLMGRDSFESLERWKSPERIRELCTVAILERDTGSRKQDDDALTVATRRIDISSSEIRKRRKEGKSIAGFVPDGVLKYIEANNLYAPEGVTQE